MAPRKSWSGGHFPWWNISGQHWWRPSSYWSLYQTDLHSAVVKTSEKKYQSNLRKVKDKTLLTLFSSISPEMLQRRQHTSHPSPSRCGPSPLKTGYWEYRHSLVMMWVLTSYSNSNSQRNKSKDQENYWPCPRKLRSHTGHFPVLELWLWA